MGTHTTSARFQALGLSVPRVLTPRKGLDLTKWAVIACDQFTSDSDYWRRVEKNVGSDPSALRMILPERYLGETDVDRRVNNIIQSMRDYLSTGILEEQQAGFVLVERQTQTGAIRTGLIAAIDLDCYDYRAGATSLIRATEGTIAERIPPRTRVRRGAPIELPHILVLYDDPSGTVLEEVQSRKPAMKPLYDFTLMENGGNLRAFHVSEDALVAKVLQGFERLADPTAFESRYGTQNVLLFAVGDGNHSLAAAKTVWEETRAAEGLSSDSQHPGRFALVELVNIHDPGLEFEPIHRVVFGVPERLNSFLAKAPEMRVRRTADRDEMVEAVERQSGGHCAGMITNSGCSVLELPSTGETIAAAALQRILDAFLASEPQASIDYIHGAESAFELGRQPGNTGFFLPALSKESFFDTIIRDGSFPRKTFSMGEAEEKRYYLEARRIVPD